MLEAGQELWSPLPADSDSRDFAGLGEGGGAKGKDFLKLEEKDAVS